MSFRDLELPVDLDTSVHNPVTELFVPLLQHAKRYDVAVGYFSTTWIRDAAEGVAHLAMNGGRARWVFSPELSKSDWDSISDSTNDADRENLVNILANRDIYKLIDELEENAGKTLSWLVEDKVIEIRFAIPRYELSGIFHAKIGVFVDEEENVVAFSGSYNLTGAANTNWESLDIFTSLRPSDTLRLESKVEKFERIWTKTDQNLRVFDSTDVALEPFKRIANRSRRPYVASEGLKSKKIPRIPGLFLNDEGKLRKHQEEAIRRWFRNEGMGILNMATGSGKTVTALAAVTRLCQRIIEERLTILIVVVVPFRHLAEQWRKEAEQFNFAPIMCFGDYPDWGKRIGHALVSLSSGVSKFEFVIAVNDTFASQKFQEAMQGVDTNFVFVADEMHNLGAEQLRQALPENARFRMGLSATPERHHDEEGTGALRAYFGDEVIDYGIRDAIRDKTLTEYFYYPVLVELTDEEVAEYRDLTERLSRNYSRENDSFKNDSILRALLMQRSRLIAGASNKYDALRSLLRERKDTKYNLIYVGDTSESGERAVDAYTRMIGQDIQMRARQFTARESSSERKEILEKFGRGDLQAIVAIRCLDEGVDIPKTETAYITASTTNPRQFIQRRGRVLRKAEGKKFSNIYDFIVVPPAQSRSDSQTLSTERSLVRKELFRVEEFAKSSLNSGSSLETLRPIRERLNLMDI